MTLTIKEKKVLKDIIYDLNALSKRMCLLNPNDYELKGLGADVAAIGLQLEDKLEEI
ncbi:hypothetical protein M0R19_05115 [Candidatus Pacearchaeota archaeon]|jgi:hypothetical protein|nr:hypothetical protein [Candidatus Pacearchaeota archaeon]